jgi:hypothetical protein
MHGDLIVHFAKAQQQTNLDRGAEARRRRSPGSRLGGLLWGPRRRLRQALPGGGMLPTWRHGLPARG